MSTSTATSECATEGIRVQAVSRFVPERSQTAQGIYFFAYTITISNEGEEPAQLVTRHWIITDSSEHVEEVRGPGVVGETPLLQPGQSFTYTSGCMLRTAYGTMRGSYQMVRPDGKRFDAQIAPFVLAMPHAVN